MSDDEVDVASSGSVSGDEANALEQPSHNDPTLHSRPPGARPLLDYRSLSATWDEPIGGSGVAAGRPAIAYRLSKYEYTKLKGVRIEQLQRGAIPCVPYDSIEAETTETLFRREFLRGSVPLRIARELPNGRTVYIPIHAFADRAATMYT